MNIWNVPKWEVGRPSIYILIHWCHKKLYSSSQTSLRSAAASARWLKCIGPTVSTSPGRPCAVYRSGIMLLKPNRRTPGVISFPEMYRLANLHKFWTKIHSEPDYIKTEQHVYRGHADEHFTGTTAPGYRTHSVLIILHIIAGYPILIQRLRKTQRLRLIFYIYAFWL